MLLSTHNMEEAAHLCDRLVIINQGKILAEGEPDELVERYVGKAAMELHITEEVRGKRPRTLSTHFQNDSTDRFDLSEAIPEGTKVVYRPANLEDVFLRLTGRGLIE